MTKWLCPRCRRWVKETMGKVCQQCREAEEEGRDGR